MTLMKHLVIAPVLLCAAHCVAPSQHDSSKWPTYTVALAEPIHHSDITLDPAPWRVDQLRAIQDEIMALWALGPTFVITQEDQAKLLIRPFDAKVDGMPKDQVGRYQEGTNFIECDPARAEGYEALKTCIGHEIGHWLRLRHVCQQPYEVGECSPVGYGVAMMNPSISYGDPITHEAFSQATPTDLDLAEFRATRATDTISP